jgi:hypothetical protein
VRDQRFVDLLGLSHEQVLRSTLIAPHGASAESEEIEGRRYVFFPDKGFDLGFGAHLELQSIFFHAGTGRTENATGIPERASRSEVIAMFGLPNASGAAQKLPVLGQFGAWDRWDHVDHSLHVQYAADGDVVERATLMHPSAVPR